MIIRFHIDLEPKPSNKRKAVMVRGHARVAQSPEVRNHQATIAYMAAEFAPVVPFTGAVSVRIVCVLPRPKLPKKFGSGPLPHAKRPDADNLAKSVLDGLNATGRWWADDCQVQRLMVEKWIAAEGETPHYYVEVSDG
jgi:Holliday junction resolvase RusA-like endonuclease